MPVTIRGDGTIDGLTIDGLPTQTGQAGKYLTTDGTAASWAEVAGGVAATTPYVVYTAQTSTDDACWFYTSAVDSDGSLYLGGDQTGTFAGQFGPVVKVTADGAVAWKVTCGTSDATDPRYISAMALAGDLVIVLTKNSGAARAFLTALRMDTGAVAWTVELPVNTIYGMTCSQSGYTMLYSIVSTTHNITVINPVGAIVDDFTMVPTAGALSSGTQLTVDDNGTFYICTRNNSTFTLSIFRYNPAGATTADRLSLVTANASPATSVGSTWQFVAGHDNYLYLLSLDDGISEWVLRCLSPTGTHLSARVVPATDNMLPDPEGGVWMSNGTTNGFSVYRIDASGLPGPVTTVQAYSDNTRVTEVGTYSETVQRGQRPPRALALPFDLNTAAFAMARAACVVIPSRTINTEYEGQASTDGYMTIVPTGTLGSATGGPATPSGGTASLTVTTGGAGSLIADTLTAFTAWTIPVSVAPLTGSAP